jgi:hypothetical protein
MVLSREQSSSLAPRGPPTIGHGQEMDKQLSVTKDDGGGLIFLVATVIIILMVVVFVYLAGAVSAGQQSGAISPQEQSRKLGVIKPPDIGDTGIAPRCHIQTPIEVWK